MVVFQIFKFGRWENAADGIHLFRAVKFYNGEICVEEGYYIGREKTRMSAACIKWSLASCRLVPFALFPFVNQLYLHNDARGCHVSVHSFFPRSRFQSFFHMVE